jgi:hypothetical protein
MAPHIGAAWPAARDDPNARDAIRHFVCESVKLRAHLGSDLMKENKLDSLETAISSLHSLLAVPGSKFSDNCPESACLLKFATEILAAADDLLAKRGQGYEVAADLVIEALRSNIAKVPECKVDALKAYCEAVQPLESVLLSNLSKAESMINSVKIDAVAFDHPVENINSKAQGILNCKKL